MFNYPGGSHVAAAVWLCIFLQTKTVNSMSPMTSFDSSNFVNISEVFDL